MTNAKLFKMKDEIIKDEIIKIEKSFKKIFINDIVFYNVFIKRVEFFSESVGTILYLDIFDIDTNRHLATLSEDNVKNIFGKEEIDIKINLKEGK